MENQREVELVNSFNEYLDVLIKDFYNIDYDNVRGKFCSADVGTVTFYKLFIGQLISRLKDIKSKITISDILGHSTIEEFHNHESIVIPMKDRFQKIQTDISASHSNLQKFRNKPIVLGDGYIANVSGYQEDYSISIFNKSITSPETRIINGKILDYRIVRRWISEDDSMQIEHEIIIFNPISNLKYITHTEEIADELIDNELTDVDTEVAKVDVESVETDTETCEEKDNSSDDREVVFKNQFVEYLDHLLSAFKAIDYDQVQRENSHTNGGARVVFYKDIIKQIINLLTVLKSKVTVDDIVGNRWYNKSASKCCVALTITGRFPEISLPYNYSDFFLKYLLLGNGYKISLEGVPKYREIYITNDKIISPAVRNKYNIADTIIGYCIKQCTDSEGNDTHIEHEIIFFNPIANLRFIKGYPDDDDPVETDVEVDENDEDDDDDTAWDVEEDDFPPDDWFPSDSQEEKGDKITVSKSENTEPSPSDNNKTLNFSLPGPNGTKMSINLNINITFE